MEKTEQKPKKPRRPRGSGSVYLKGRFWWFKYQGPDGKAILESSSSTRKGDAQRLLQRRIGAREHGLPVVPNAEKVMFGDAAKAMLDDYRAKGRRSTKVAERRVKKHLLPYFGGRLASITTADIQGYVAHRKAQGVVINGKRQRDVSDAEINRELAHLKRIFSIAIHDGIIGRKPRISMADERGHVRRGFFEAEMLDSVLGHLPDEHRPVIRFAAITGWRIASEVLPLEWRQVDFAAGEVRLDSGTTKNGDGRVFPFTAKLRLLMREQKAEHDRLKKAGHICPYVFFREVADGRGGPKKPQEILSLTKGWKTACRLAGCPGRIPHDLRRTAIRTLVRSGVPERVAMKLTGHKTPSVFARYDIVSDGDLREAAAKLDSGVAAAAAKEA